VMPRLDAAGYPIVMHTHDEWVCEVPDGHGTLEEFLTIVSTPPSWAPDLPIAAKARISDRLIEIPEPTQAATPTTIWSTTPSPSLSKTAATATVRTMTMK
jgi:hypothetical protein